LQKCRIWYPRRGLRFREPWTSNLKPAADSSWGRCWSPLLQYHRPRTMKPSELRVYLRSRLLIWALHVGKTSKLIVFWFTVRILFCIHCTNISNCGNTIPYTTLHDDEVQCSTHCRSICFYTSQCNTREVLTLSEKTTLLVFIKLNLSFFWSSRAIRETVLVMGNPCQTRKYLSLFGQPVTQKFSTLCGFRSHIQIKLWVKGPSEK
jgi:hypothetical protein